MEWEGSGNGQGRVQDVMKFTITLEGVKPVELDLSPSELVTALPHLV